MKKLLLLVLVAVSLTSCSEVVKPNFYGVLMENYGKSGKSDYSKVQGKVFTMMLGTELYQVPAFIQRAEFTEGEKDTKRILHLKAADNTEFLASPQYSYSAMPEKVVDLVFQNARLGSGDDFMRALEDNVLEPQIYDLIKEESRKYTTDELMATGGSLKFEDRIQEIIRKEFAEKGLKLESFSTNLDFSQKVKDKINDRNEVNTNLSVLDQKINEQKKANELEALKAEQNIIRSRGLTPQVLELERIHKWNGVLPIGNNAIQLMKNVN
jgi:hypothetical protein